jgi:hypothetical protein
VTLGTDDVLPASSEHSNRLTTITTFGTAYGWPMRYMVLCDTGIGTKIDFSWQYCMFDSALILMGMPLVGLVLLFATRTRVV